MTKKISLDLPEKDYEELSSLGQLYNRDVNQVILDVINAVSTESHSIKTIRKESKVPIDLTSAIYSVFYAGRNAIDNLFNPILDKLGVKGLYLLNDMEFDIDDNSLSISFNAHKDCNLHIDEFNIWLESGGPSILASSYVETEKINIEKLRKLIEKADCPETEDYAELDTFETSMLDEDEEIATIQINLSAETVDDFPSIETLSIFVEKLLTKAKL
ncbi:MAG: hypothetical protein IAX21_00910 [Candidatus Bathyarchaeota archaeon]|nr:hypothetical protein [Candidatus Bathyarchaeum tardum]WGM90470.1 MAG: hypothetical protein NUK63_04935 [Candidatus Bathyarchaeum tardum]WNZ29462.1 MAG: hypothetical protein IAX21_00910 [Candidatus Bathyarchaeota archaeon]